VLNAGSGPIHDILLKSLHNLHFMVKDLFWCRSELILTATRQQIKIDETTLLPTEIDFYRGLHTSFRGFSNSMNTILAEISINQDKTQIDPRSPQIQISRSPNPISSPEIVEVPHPNSSPTRLTIDTKSAILAEITQKAPLTQKKQTIAYTPLRVLKTVPSLVGVDMRVYGPFQEEDLVFLPIRNAEILIAEKVATVIKIS